MKKNYQITTLALLICGASIFNPGSGFLNASTAQAAPSMSTMEIQRNIQKNWAAVENSKVELDSILSMNKSEIANLDTEIAGAKSALNSSTPGSTEHLEGKTRLTELFTSRTIMAYKSDQASKRICSDILQKMLRIEENLNDLNSVHAQKARPEVKKFQKQIRKYISGVVEEASLETSAIANNLAKNTDPILSRWVRNSARDWKKTSLVVNSNLNKSGDAGSYSQDINKMNTATSRSMFETMIAELNAGMDHKESILHALKVNAELQVAKLVALQMNKTVRGMSGSIEDNYDVNGNNVNNMSDWEMVRLTAPSTEILSY